MKNLTIIAMMIGLGLTSCTNEKTYNCPTKSYDGEVTGYVEMDEPCNCECGTAYSDTTNINVLLNDSVFNFPGARYTKVVGFCDYYGFGLTAGGDYSGIVCFEDVDWVIDVWVYEQ